MIRRSYVVVPAKGGAGATTVAFELAEKFRGNAPIVLIDADLHGRRSHAVTFDASGDLDAARLPGAPATATVKGKTLIELARSHDEGLALVESQIDALHAQMPSDAIVVVDAPQPLAPPIRPLLARATRLVVVTEPTLLGVAAAIAMTTALKRLGIPAQRLAFVVNAGRGPSEFSREEIERTLGGPVVATLPARRDRGWQRAVDGLASDLARTAATQTIELRPPTAPARNDEPAPHADNVIPFVAPRAATVEAGFSPERERLKTELHGMIMQKVDFDVAARAHSDVEKLKELRTQVEAIVAAHVARVANLSPEESERVRRELVEEAIGLGPLEPLMRDPRITEIMVNGHTNIYIERAGQIEQTPLRFADDRQVRLVIDRIIAPLGRRIDESSPMVDARLPDGSRVNAIIEPLAIDGPTLTIRRFGSRRLSMDDLVAANSVPAGCADFLRAAVEARLNVVFSGGTGTGKTTLLNAASAFIPRNERIITVEDAAELNLDQPHVVRLESRPPNLEGTGAVAIRELVRNALRMRPDRIVIGECRGGEALDMLQAMNTGHDGSLTTVHANSARDALSRIETMVLMAGYDLPIRAVREQIASAVDIVVQIARLRDGSRRVVSVSEVIGMEGDVVTMQDVARFHQRGVDAHGTVLGTFEPTGVQPTSLRRFEEMGVAFDIGAFQGTATHGVRWAAQ